MRYFPIFLDLKDRKVIVVGGGEEALLPCSMMNWLLSLGLNGWHGVLRRICWKVRRWFMRLTLNSIVL